MLSVFILATVRAIDLFHSSPQLVGANDNQVKVVYSLGNEIQSAEVGTDDLDDVSLKFDYYADGFYYASATFNKYEVLRWEIYDFVGRKSVCKTIAFDPSANRDDEEDPCQAEGCYPSMIGDGWCDKACLNEACGFDGEDCEVQNSVKILGCSIKQIGNGFCDPECNNQISFFDAGDCSLPCQQPKCSQYMLGNGKCERECMYEECMYDGGDCENCASGCSMDSLSDGKCQNECNNEACGYDHGDCKKKGDKYNVMCSYHGCSKDMLDNNICDPVCRNKECGFDWKDCVDEDDCEDLDCDYDNIADDSCDYSCYTPECSYDGGDCHKEICSFGCYEISLGDGNCDPACDTFMCGYDRGDCAQKLCSDYCSEDYPGDEICEPHCNNKDCAFDKGDCERISVEFVPEGILVRSEVLSVVTNCVKEGAWLLSIGWALLTFSQ
mmetsp:Transcript_7614/g.14337  ORF Transcript_7614/g.14337 Transcript_7614/m.14337 type:complete len:439 (+) Transcript_7614:6491-7807(+)